MIRTDRTWLRHPARFVRTRPLGHQGDQARIGDRRGVRIRELGSTPVTFTDHRVQRFGIYGVQHGSARVNEFHSRILEAAGSDNLTLLLNGMFDLPLVRRTFLKYSREDLHRSEQHYQELVEVLRARDSESAEIIMKVRTRTAQRTVLARETSLHEAPSEAD